MVKQCKCGSDYTVESPGQDYCGVDCRSRYGIKQRTDGYRMRYAPDHPKTSDKGYVMEHVLIAEDAIGRVLPEGAVVHHVDGDRTNNVNSNLVVCEDQKYHMLLHVRARVIAAGGDPDLHKVCPTCERPKLKDGDYTRNASNWDGLHGECRACKVQRESKRKRDRRRERNTKIQRERLPAQPSLAGSLGVSGALSG